MPFTGVGQTKKIVSRPRFSDLPFLGRNPSKAMNDFPTGPLLCLSTRRACARVFLDMDVVARKICWQLLVIQCKYRRGMRGGCGGERVSTVLPSASRNQTMF